MASIKIVECNEPLVDIKKYCPKVVIAIDKKRLSLEKNFYLRKTMAKMINKATDYLPTGTTFIIRDAWRPQSVQEKIFKGFFARFSKKYPNWKKQRIINEINKYVAPATGKHASGHMTGGAIDLRLIKNGRKVPMNDRSHKLTYQENAKSIQPKLPQYLQKNRQLMFDALIKAGLSNYPKEYWHWSYGDIQWARRNKKKIAIYGVITKIN
ncbi:MAG: M15 family metallopeptidase [Patescibacteria group bacterium]